jgi:hypothetical protein
MDGTGSGLCQMKGCGVRFEVITAVKVSIFFFCVVT